MWRGVFNAQEINSFAKEYQFAAMRTIEEELIDEVA